MRCDAADSLRDSERGEEMEEIEEIEERRRWTSSSTSTSTSTCTSRNNARRVQLPPLCYHQTYFPSAPQERSLLLRPDVFHSLPTLQAHRRPESSED
eukprot:767272-Hanusia_phi.AAC.1